MYRAFLELCGGTLEGDQVTVYAPDEITLNRLDNDRVRGVLFRRSGEGLRPAGAGSVPGGRGPQGVPSGKSEKPAGIWQQV